MFKISHAEIDDKDHSYYFLDTQRVAITHADPEAELSIRRGLSSLVISITPSNQDLRQDIINNLLVANRMLGIKIIFSSSLKISRLISYTVAI